MAAEITWALVLATTIHFFLGAIWYGPLFGKAWAKLAYGKEEIDFKGTGPIWGMICALVGGFVGMSVIEVMVSYHDANTAAAGAAVGLVAALADTAFHLAGNVFESRPLGLFIINQTYHTVSFMAAGAVFATLDV